MKNSIWVGRGVCDIEFMSHAKFSFSDDGQPMPQNGLHCIVKSHCLEDCLHLNLKPLEIVEIIIDTDTQTYEVKRQREVGWYLTAFEEQSQVTARYWNGNIWKPMPRYNLHCSDENITVVSSIIKDNEYLRGLE